MTLSLRYVATAMAARIENCGRHVAYACGMLYVRANDVPTADVTLFSFLVLSICVSTETLHVDINPPLYVTSNTVIFVMLFRGDFGTIIHTDINPPLYVTKTQLYLSICVSTETSHVDINPPLYVTSTQLYREGLHVYAAAGDTRALMGMHVPTADVT
jgi:hypothetical protein